MRGVRGLTVILADAAKIEVALTLAAAQAALEGRGRVYFHESAVSAAAEAAAFAVDHNVELIVCQTGLAQAGIDHATLPPTIAAGGLISLLAELGDDRLVTL
ncbi:MAG: hypothetical protein V4659_06880 [Pseudomonadota bacterium]